MSNYRDLTKKFMLHKYFIFSIIIHKKTITPNPNKI